MQHMAEQLIPLAWRTGKRFGENEVQYSYHNYKTKCLAPPDSPPGLICVKKHAHEREVVSDRCTPLRNLNRLFAKGLRDPVDPLVRASYGHPDAGGPVALLALRGAVGQTLRAVYVNIMF